VSGILAAKGEEEGCVGEWGWRGGTSKDMFHGWTRRENERDRAQQVWCMDSVGCRAMWIEC